MSAFTQEQEQRLREIVAEVLAEHDNAAARLDARVDAVTRPSRPHTPDQPRSRGCD